MRLWEASVKVFRVRVPKGTAKGALVPVVVSMSGVAPQVEVPVLTPAIVKEMVGSTVAVTLTASTRAILPVVASTSTSDES